MNTRTVITVDGLAGSGKSTLSALLAHRIGFALLNSGLLYRAIGFIALQRGCNVESEAEVIAAIGASQFELQEHRLPDSVENRLILEGADVTEALREPKVSEATSTISQHPMVRSKLFEMQRNVFPGRGLVAEGRDMGTVVFPTAPLKFFVVADPAVRVARRLKQLSGEAHKLDVNHAELLKKKMEQEVIERDRRDSERSVSPTKPAPDAISIDNTALSLTATVQTMYAHASQRGLVTH